MSDSLELLRAANPIPAPQSFASATRHRMVAAIVAHDPASQEGRFARLRRRLSRRRLYLIAVAAVLAAGGTAGAVAVLHDEQSAPLSGALPGPPGGRYSFSVIPSLGAGAIGWCIDEETQMPAPTLRELARRLRSYLEQALTKVRAELTRGHVSAARRQQLRRYVTTTIPDALRSLTPTRYRSSSLLHEFARSVPTGAGSGVCGDASMRGRPIVAAMRAGGSGRHVGLYLTASDVAAVRISPTVTILTRADPQLPDGYRFAVVDEPKGRAAPVAGSGPWAVAALSASGHVIPARFVPGEGEIAVPWRRRHGRATVGEPTPRTKPPPAACEIDPRGLSNATLYYGSVVVHVRGSARLEGDPYLSCAYMQLYYRGYTVQAAVLLDARNPGRPPALLPGSVTLRSRPGTVNEPPRSGQQPITARRIGNAWLVVESINRGGSSSLSERLAVLDRLTACVRPHGTPCP
ncbi:MAG: hypothetical protein ACRDLP_01200 [Solirubrobacteraceae bacterium]